MDRRLLSSCVHFKRCAPLRDEHASSLRWIAVVSSACVMTASILCTPTLYARDVLIDGVSTVALTSLPTALPTQVVSIPSPARVPARGTACCGIADDSAVESAVDA